MKIFITTDMEGISGVVAMEQCMPESPYYNEGRQYLTEEINACIQGCLDGGATEIIVSDAHFRGRNLIWHELHPSAKYLIGSKAKYPDSRMPGIESCDGLILLGYHAMAGTEKAVLEHTWSSQDWQNFWINGQLAGEIAIEMGLASEFNVPAIMISGDNMACREASALVPDIVTAQVKEAVALYGACLLSRDSAHSLIRQKATEAVKKCKEIKPVSFRTPVSMRLEYVERKAAFSSADKPYMKVIDSRTFEVTGDSFALAFNRLLRA